MDYISVHFQMLKESCSNDGVQIALAIILESLVSEGILTCISLIIRLIKTFILSIFFTRTLTPTFSKTMI